MHFMSHPHPLLPDDPHDRRVVANTHPADWRNPRPASRYDLVVVGGGTAGLVSARSPHAPLTTSVPAGAV